MFDLYLITPDLAPPAILARCALALAGVALGGSSPPRVAVQLRSKQLAPEVRRALAHELRALTRAHAAQLLINADVALALEVNADGVQLPEHAPSVAAARAQLPTALLLGASRHDLRGVLDAARDGASFATLSPIFGVPDKGEPLGIEALTAIAARSPIPLLALGGIDAARAHDAIRAGAHGVAVIRDVWSSADPTRAVANLLARIDAGRGARGS